MSLVLPLPRAGRIARQICKSRWEVGDELMRSNPFLKEMIVDQHRVWNSPYDWKFVIIRDTQGCLKHQTYVNGVLCEELKVTGE